VLHRRPGYVRGYVARVWIGACGTATTSTLVSESRAWNRPGTGVDGRPGSRVAAPASRRLGHVGLPGRACRHTRVTLTRRRRLCSCPLSHWSSGQFVIRAHITRPRRALGLEASVPRGVTKAAPDGASGHFHVRGPSMAHAVSDRRRHAAFTGRAPGVDADGEGVGELRSLYVYIIVEPSSLIASRLPISSWV
jgi:hypothetical protein